MIHANVKLRYFTTASRRWPPRPSIDLLVQVCSSFWWTHRSGESLGKQLTVHETHVTFLKTSCYHTSLLGPAQCFKSVGYISLHLTHPSLVARHQTPSRPGSSDWSTCDVHRTSMSILITYHFATPIIGAFKQKTSYNHQTNLWGRTKCELNDYIRGMFNL